MFDKEEMIVWEIGDVCNDGHGKHDSFNILVKYNGKEDAIKKLENTEDAIQEKFGIDLSKWFEYYEDYNIPAEDVKKLDELNIKYEKSNLTIDNRLSIWLAEEYFQIWKQLIEKADNNLKIEKVEPKIFYGKCTGYGLYE